MQLISSYARRLKTSRKFVFENIMDLDHVCTLHKRWFRNLRIRTWKRTYVEYRLTSLFYGLSQEILVKGAPIDENSYWYEFIAPLAHIRVDGSMEGSEGDIVLTEKITYRFAWPFAPFFWLLGPVFKSQKEDILLADSQLLERMYELEQSGFQRTEDSRPRIVVYGGNGFFGKLLVADLLEHSKAHVIIASRKATPVVDFVNSANVTMVESDVNNRESVLETIEKAALVICCTGPYQGHSLTLLQACIEKGIHYVDVADDRDFVERCYQLREQIEKAGIMAFVGCSVVPGMSTLLTKYSQEKIAVIDQAKICITPGTRHPRGPGSFRCLLSTVGKDIVVAENSTKSRTIQGWTEREQKEFPPPIGRRWVYSIVDIADYFVQPFYFGTKRVEFKIGAELDFLNRGLSLVRLMKRSLQVSDLDWFVSSARPLILISSFLGTSRGALMVEVSDSAANKSCFSVFREERGEIIPAILPSVAAQMIINQEVQFKGLAVLSEWLPLQRFTEELSKRRIKFATKVGEEWKGLNY